MAYLILERPKGLDFSRDAKGASAQSADMREYKKTPFRFLRLAFDAMPSDRRRFLDIGCGKGYVLSAVRKYSGFIGLGGIEYDGEIADICRRNMSRLGYTDVKVWTGDARDFKHYRDYDTFFFFNPFGPEIFKTVLKNIPAEDSWLIYVNPVCHQVIVEDGRFRLERTLRWGIGSTQVNLYAGIPASQGRLGQDKSV